MIPRFRTRLRRRILGGDTTAFFKAVEIVHGKPRQAVQIDAGAPTTFSWKSDLVSTLEEGRKRVAAARERKEVD